MPNKQRQRMELLVFAELKFWEFAELKFELELWNMLLACKKTKAKWVLKEMESTVWMRKSRKQVGFVRNHLRCLKKIIKKKSEENRDLWKRRCRLSRNNFFFF